MERLKQIPALLKLRLERARARYGAVDIVMSTFKTFSLDDGGSYAAALTYYTFFSIFPLILFSAAILGFVTRGNPELRQELIEAGIRSVPLIRDVLTDETLRSIEERRQAFAISGMAIALYSGSGAVVALEHALNRFHGLINEPNWIMKRLRSLRFLAVFGLAALVSVALGGLATSAGAIFAGQTAGVAVAWALGHLFGFAIGVAIFASAYKFLPAVQQSWRDVLPGAITAAALFEVLKEVGSLYMERGSASRAATFGAFSIAAGLLLASFLMAQITLLAAELNDVVIKRRESRQTQGITT